MIFPIIRRRIDLLELNIVPLAATLVIFCLIFLFKRKLKKIYRRVLFFLAAFSATYIFTYIYDGCSRFFRESGLDYRLIPSTPFPFGFNSIYKKYFYRDPDYICLENANDFLEKLVCKLDIPLLKYSARVGTLTEAIVLLILTTPILYLAYKKLIKK